MTSRKTLQVVIDEISEAYVSEMQLSRFLSNKKNLNEVIFMKFTRNVLCTVCFTKAVRKGNHVLSNGTMLHERLLEQI